MNGLVQTNSKHSSILRHGTGQSCSSKHLNNLFSNRKNHKGLGLPLLVYSRSFFWHARHKCSCKNRRGKKMENYKLFSTIHNQEPCGSFCLSSASEKRRKIQAPWHQRKKKGKTSPMVGSQRTGNKLAT